MLITTSTLLVLAVLSGIHGQSIPLKKDRLVHEYINSRYVGPVAVNNGSAPYLFIFDTSSSNIVMVNDSCKGGACASCQFNKISNPASPDDQPVTVTILDNGSATGTKATASFTITDDNQSNTTLNVPSQVYVSAEQISDGLCSTGADGVFGLPPLNSNSTAYGDPSFLQNANNAGESNGVFVVHHGRFENGEHFGEVIFGGADSKYYNGNFTCAPLVNPQKNWDFALVSLSIGSKNYLTGGSAVNGMVDTSKNVILGPKELIDLINDDFSCTDTNQGDIVICQFDDCQSTEELEDLTIAYNGGSITIASKYYIQQNGNTCYSGFMPYDTDKFHFGDFVIDHYNCKFDGENEQMCFAPTKEEES